MHCTKCSLVLDSIYFGQQHFSCKGNVIKYAFLIHFISRKSIFFITDGAAKSASRVGIFGKSGYSGELIRLNCKNLSKTTSISIKVSLSTKANFN
jgi:hypothetical protein